MKKHLLFLCSLLLTGSLLAQDDTRSFDDFVRLSVSTSVKVELIQSSSNKAEIWIEDGELEDLYTDQSGERLKIYWKSNDWGNKWNKRKARIKLYYSDLEAIQVSAGGRVEGSETIRAEDFDVNASSGGGVDISLSADRVDADVSSGGWVEVEGSTDRLNVDASSGGSFKGADLKAKRVIADASSGGNARVWATESIEAEASSGGNVRYKGNPTKKDISSSKWSGGAVRAMD
ncbi:MAG: DUF2807 domain-containing protein [Bacteroidia bacterium]|nr:DUF2807 domain-containing protein [Bacteroidia bacterium]